MNMLRDELLNDPILYGYSNMTEDQIVALYGIADRPIKVRVPISTLVQYLAANDLYVSILDKRNDSSAMKARPARVIAELLTSPHLTDIDVNSPIFQGGMASLLNDEVITAQHFSDITEMGTKLVTRPEELNLTGTGERIKTPVRAGHIQEARA